MLSFGRHHRYTYSEYVALEEHANARHELRDAEIYEIAAGPPSMRRSARTSAPRSTFIAAIDCTLDVDDVYRDELAAG